MLKVIIVMGVAGSGKTTVGKLLAAKLKWNFADADDFHSAANVRKMSEGHALTDEDREPWLETLRASIQSWTTENVCTVLACSALKERYRKILQINDDVSVVYLRGDFKLFENRLSNRHGHFMKTEMLKSQFQTLEEPDAACIVDASKDAESIVEKIFDKLVSAQHQEHG